MIRVYNGGTYDLIHAGHLFAFRQMRQIAGAGGEVVVGLNSDEFVERFKHHPTVQSLAERLELVAAIRYVDRVVVNFGDEDSRPILELVMPDIIAVGHDWHDAGAPEPWARYYAQMRIDEDWLRLRRIKLVGLDWMPDRSSTEIRQTVRRQDDRPEPIVTHSGPIQTRLRRISGR